MIIYLIRHGETTVNKQSRFLGHFNVALSEHGIEQAKLASTLLDKVNLTGIYTSDLKRAMQTAEIIAVNKQLMVIPTKGLREIDFGDWEGLTHEEIRSVDIEKFTAWLNDFESVQIPEGESWTDFTKRVMNTFITIIDSVFGDKNIAIVTHGGPIRFITSCLIANENHFESFWPAPGSVHMVNLERKKPDSEIIDIAIDSNLTQCRRLTLAYKLVDYHFNLQIS